MHWSWRNKPHFNENSLNFCIKKVVKCYFRFFLKILKFFEFFSCLAWLYQVTTAYLEYQRSEMWECIIRQNSHLFTHLLFPVWRRLVRGTKKPNQLWRFAIFQVTTSSMYVRQLISILQGTICRGLGKANFLLTILKHINLCPHQQSPGGLESFSGSYREINV